MCKLKVDRELLDRVKSLKLEFYGHTTRKYESLEKEMVHINFIFILFHFFIF